MAAAQGHSHKNLASDQIKENFFQYLTGMPDGRTFLSTVAEKIMERTQHYLMFSFASAK
jgi:hypothetical protein